MRSECYFYHPARGNVQGFHWDQRTKPPIMEPARMMTSTGKIPVRVSVIVMNKKKVDEDLSKSLEGLVLE